MPAIEAESHSQAPPPNTTTTPDKSNIRKAREPNDSETVYIKYGKEVDLLTLKCMQPNVNDIYFVRLKSDDEGGSKETRQKHINEIFGLCCTHSRDAAGNEFDGIEVRFEEAMPAYAGHFNPVVVKVIEAHKKDIVVSVDKSYRMTMCGERPSRNWGTAKISLEKDQWDKMPEDSTEGFKCKGDDKVYRYRYGDHLGKGVTIYIIDAGGFLKDDFVKDQKRVQTGLSWMGGNKPEGHGTIVTNIAAGETCGVAPEASVWLWSPVKPADNINCIVALERILKMEEEKHQAWKSDNTKSYYSVLNVSFAFEKKDFKGDDASFKSAKASLSGFFEKVLAKGVFTVVAAGNDGEEIDSSEDCVVPRNLKDVFKIGSSDRNNQISAISNYGQGVIAYAPGEDIPILGSTKTESGTSLAAPHVSGLLACLLSSELAQETPPKGVEQKRWSIDDVRTKLHKNFSRVEHIYQGFPINVIFNEMQNITDLRIEKVDDKYKLSIPPFGISNTVKLEDLEYFFKLLKKPDYKGCDWFLQHSLNIKNGTELCLKAVKSVTVILDKKPSSEPIGGADGLASPKAAPKAADFLIKQLTPPPK